MGHPIDRITPQLLQWLHSVITPEYTDTRRTYTDIIQTLRVVPSLSPRTDVYTHENGRSQLLLCLYGTLPAIFRSQTYNIPLVIWIPHQYPQHAPISFVTPSKDMLIRPGNHVDASGRCYHPYLANWERYLDRSNIADLCDVLRGVFSREPPVYAKPIGAIPLTQSQSPPPPPRPPLPAELESTVSPPLKGPPPVIGGPPVPPPVPPLPKELAPPTPVPRQPTAHAPVPPPPPPPPPKPNQPGQTSPQHPITPGGHSRSNSLPSRGPVPPPIPPAPHRALSPPQQYQRPPPEISTQGHTHSPYGYLQRPLSFQEYAHPQQPGVLPQGQPLASHNLQSQHQQPVGPQHPALPPRPMSYHHPPGQHQYAPSPLNPNPTPPSQHAYHPPPQPHHPPPPAHQQQAPPPKPLPVDIMNAPDTDILLSFSSNAATDPNLPLTPPPLPPNPQKDQLLSEIAKAVHARAEAATAKTNQAIEQTNAQREAILRAEVNLERERQELLRIAEVCEKDERILRERMQMADEVIRDVRTREQPEVDKVVCAPTVVHTQLYDLVTDDMAIEDTIYVLGKALDRERISLDVFLKHTRTLAREQFILRATVKKIVNQIGLIRNWV